ncbi:MAG TPA: hypothetical protein VJ903_05220, partial [Clostridia bacterium]|nr:hypothetical protein [Clostridia bacterium]
MNIFLRKLYVKHKTLSITIISFLLTFIILALLLLSANIPRSDTTSYTSEVALSNSFINEKTFLGINTNNAIDAPADTLTYFKKIFEYNNSYKVDVLELNVHLTLDNKLILSSFPTLDTFSDAKAYIGETNIRPEKQTYEQLKRYN